MNEMSNELRDAIRAIEVDVTLSQHEKVSRINKLFTDAGAPYDRLSVSVNGTRFRVVALKQRRRDRTE